MVWEASALGLGGREGTAMIPTVLQGSLVQVQVVRNSTYM